MELRKASRSLHAGAEVFDHLVDATNDFWVAVRPLVPDRHISTAFHYTGNAIRFFRDAREALQHASAVTLWLADLTGDNS